MGGAGKKWAVGGAGSESGAVPVGPGHPTLVDGLGSLAEFGVAAAPRSIGERALRLCASLAPLGTNPTPPRAKVTKLASVTHTRERRDGVRAKANTIVGDRLCDCGWVDP